MEAISMYLLLDCTVFYHDIFTNYPALATVNGILLHHMLLKFKVVLVKIIPWALRLIKLVHI